MVEKVVMLPILGGSGRISHTGNMFSMTSYSRQKRCALLSLLQSIRNSEAKIWDET